MQRIKRPLVASVGSLLVVLATAIGAPAQTFTTLLSFDETDGYWPYAGLIQATNGNLYGTTFGGGLHKAGTAFAITSSGTETGVVSFCPPPHFGCAGGPAAALIQGSDGNFYGTTLYGGDKLHGAVVKITETGKVTTVHGFLGSDGIRPEAPLIQASDTNFYGTTAGGGRHGCDWWSYGCGTVFKMDSQGGLATLYKFCSQSNCTDGANPYAAVAQGIDGNFYGTTEFGGSSQACSGGCGTVFKVTSDGALTTLYSFCSETDCSDGAAPVAGLIQAVDGNFYGTTSSGGANDNCEFNTGCGTVFEITPAGAVTTLYSFCSQSNCADGQYPLAGVIQATDGNLYGTTSQGGNDNCASLHGCGTVFEVTTSGALTTLYSFCPVSGCLDGAQPLGGLAQDTNGELYGTTAGGGEYGFYGVGTVFSLSVGLGPFVEPQTTSGKISTEIKILGTNLTGATSVTFNGTAATFAVVSPSLITTTVPAGATTGTVQVVTPGGTLKSYVPFRVIQ